MRSRRVPFQPNPEATARLRQIESMTKLMDNQFRLPGTDFRFGLDPIIGLIPFAGNIMTLVFQGFLVASMSKYGISRKVMILMVINLAIDFILGGIPFIGNIFDFYFKSSQRNLELMKRHYNEGKHQGSGTGTLMIVFLLFLAIIAAIGFLVFKLVELVYHLIAGAF
ncbi:MAG: DUF4112 domain-containing protein [Sphingobacteriales bacterium]|nr:MAG: DUF4112 domain-containing protein [Sphingobacteriales bacterium]